MYLLVSLSDVAQIHPRDFNKSNARAIEEFINAKYADRVIHKVGLCVCFHSIISTSDGLIGHGSGMVNVNVDFRVVVFRPFRGEIVNAQITQSVEGEGIELSHDFFENVLVPPETMFEGTKFDTDDQGVELYIWYSQNDDTGETTPFYFDKLENCLYRVEQEVWNDLSPNIQTGTQDFTVPEWFEEKEARDPPYQIKGSMMLTGLGPNIWWYGGEEDEAGEEANAN